MRDSLLPDGETWEEQTYSFAYDTYKNVTAVKIGSKTIASYTYMAKNGPLTKITYGNGYTIEYGYDALGRMVTEKRDGVLKYRYVYGSSGDLSRKEELNSAGTVVKASCYEYDSLDRLIRSWEETLGNGYLRRGVVTQHVYDTANRLTQQSWQLTDGTNKSEQYTYSSKDGTLSSVKTASGNTVTLTYDYLKRLAQRSDGKLTAVYGYTDASDSQTTTQINKLRYEGISGALLLNYSYDALGNITQVKQDNQVVAKCTYDAQSQLIREELPQEGQVYQYSYDTAGNIRSVTTTQGGSTVTKTYTYGDSSWRDLLTQVDGHSLSYDNIGNPLNYYNGQAWTFTWQEGRQLATAQSGSTSVSYAYDAEGLRTGKTVGDTTYSYVYLGDQLVRQTWGGKTLDFAYDDQGRPFSVTYQNKTYHYVLNLQGDVIAIVDDNGATWAEYTYDAWGNQIEVVATGSIATMNPLRYRGYIYDSETGLYYLNSRYYDSANRRFINADGLGCLGANGGLVGLNLFSYCNNGPVNHADTSGALVGTVVGAVVGGIVGAVTADVDAGEDRLKCAAIGAVSGLLAGVVIDISVATGGTVGLIVAAVGNGVVSGGTSVATDMIYGRDPDIGNALLDAGLGAFFGAATFGMAPVRTPAKSIKEVGQRFVADVKTEIRDLTMTQRRVKVKRKYRMKWVRCSTKTIAKRVAKSVAFETFAATSMTGMQAMYKMGALRTMAMFR